MRKNGIPRGKPNRSGRHEMNSLLLDIILLARATSKARGNKSRFKSEPKSKSSPMRKLDELLSEFEEDEKKDKKENKKTSREKTKKERPKSETPKKELSRFKQKDKFTNRPKDRILIEKIPIGKKVKRPNKGLTNGLEFKKGKKLAKKDGLNEKVEY